MERLEERLRKSALEVQLSFGRQLPFFQVLDGVSLPELGPLKSHLGLLHPISPTEERGGNTFLPGKCR